MQEFPMTTHNNTSTAAQETSARLATLDPSAGRITTINTYTVTPERAEEVLEYLERSAMDRSARAWVPLLQLALESRPHADSQVRPVGGSRGACSRAGKPQNRSAHERDRQDRGQFEADPLRVA